jgi:hypothetical protein
MLHCSPNKDRTKEGTGKYLIDEKLSLASRRWVQKILQ